MRAATPNRICVKIAIVVCAALLAIPATSEAQTIERWGLFELALDGPSGSNPFIDTQISAEF